MKGIVGCMFWLVLLVGSAVAGETVLVGGATGRQGAAVVDELLERGLKVRALTRKPASADAVALAERGVEVVQGDYGDKASLLRAMEGVERMFFYSGFSANEAEEGSTVIAAAAEAGLRQLVYSSGAAAEPGVGVEGSAKMQVELTLLESDVPYTVFRPVAFMENFDRQQKRFSKAGIVESRGPERELCFIAIDDIGFFVAEALENPDEWTGQAVNIAGDCMTVAHYVETFSTVMGQEIDYTRMPLEEYLQTLPKPLRPLFEWYDRVGYTADVEGLRQRYPELITLEQYLRTTGWENWQD